MGYRGSRLALTLNKKKIAIRRIKRSKEVFIAIKGPKSAYNHWTALAVVTSVAEKRRDGHAFDVAVVHRDRLIERQLRALTIKGTPADEGVEALEVNDEVVLFGIVRLDLAEIEREAGAEWKTIPMPYELIVLDIMR